jgi:hypothetical protein
MVPKQMLILQTCPNFSYNLERNINKKNDRHIKQFPHFSQTSCPTIQTLQMQKTKLRESVASLSYHLIELLIFVAQMFI